MKKAAKAIEEGLMALFAGTCAYYSGKMALILGFENGYQLGHAFFLAASAVSAAGAVWFAARAARAIEKQRKKFSKTG